MHPVPHRSKRLLRTNRQLRRDPGASPGTARHPRTHNAGRRGRRANRGTKIEQRLGEVGRSRNGIRIGCQAISRGANCRLGARHAPVIANSRATMRSTLPSTGTPGRPKAIAAIASRCTGPIPGSRRRLSARPETRRLQPPRARRRADSVPARSSQAPPTQRAPRPMMPRPTRPPSGTG